MHEKFKLAKSRMQFSRLMGLCEQQQKALAEDPGPFLDRAYEEILKSRQLIDDVYAALNGLDDAVKPQLTDRYESIASTLMRRNEKALELIRNAQRTEQNRE